VLAQGIVKVLLLDLETTGSLGLRWHRNLTTIRSPPTVWNSESESIGAHVVVLEHLRN
jgi:hypothetical protein